ncbi:MAG: tetratricopeptide repeat protein [Bacteroidota bacterium]
MANILNKIRIFLASPYDVATERAKLETVVTSLKPLADYLGLTLEVLDWRGVVPDAGRPQQIIFDQLKPTSWDIFVGILWHRFGTPPGGKDLQTQKDYLSGTEEEFRIAYRLWKEYGRPRIVMYRCMRAIPLDADLAQAQRVKNFFKEIQKPQSEFRVLTQSFDTTESFEKLLLDNLQKLLLEYGEQSKTPITPDVVQVLAPRIPNNLPRRAAFFGRAKEMDVVMRALSPTDRTWGVLVDGIGGIGKSAIAIEAAYRTQEGGLFDAFVFITAKQNILEPSGIHELNPPAHTLDEFLNETARVLGQSGIAKLASSEKRRALLDALRVMPALLIYDNLETLSKEEQEAMADFLRELPQGCKAIITSRRRGGEGAVWLRVEKLDWDAARGIIKNEMARDTGMTNKLRHIESRWQELYDETNGSPLALVHTLGLMRVRTTLTFDGALEMLHGNRDADLHRFIFQEARKELTTNDKTALGALSFFVPSATFEAWMQVANLSRVALTTTIDRLSALSLVDVLTGEERYTLHPLTRAFVHDELLADVNNSRKMGMRFAQYWVDYTKRYGGGSKNYRTFRLLEAEWTNLDAAANWLWETAGLQGEKVGDKEAARMLNELALALHAFLSFSGRWDERVHIDTQAYKAMRAIEDWSNAGWHAYRVAYIHFNCARTDDAVFWTDRCTEMWTRGGTKFEQAVGIRMRGLIAVQRKEYDTTERIYQDALVIFRDLKNDEWISIMFSDLGGIERMRKNYDAAERYYREALEIETRREDKEGQATYMCNLGNLAFDRKQWAEVHKWCEQALALAKEVGRQDLVAINQNRLACVYEAEGRADLALPLAQEALKIYERLQHKELTTARELVNKLSQKFYSNQQER